MNSNTVIWRDIIIFNDGSFILETIPVNIVQEFRAAFNKHYFNTEQELINFFGAHTVIYDCDNFKEYVRKRHGKPFRVLLLDSVRVSKTALAQLDKQFNLQSCGGYINGIHF